jgi:hypothetical protein
VFYYYLKDKPSSQISLELVDSSGKLIKKFTSRAPEKQANANPGGTAPAEQQQASTGEEEEEGPRRGGGPTRIPAEQGMNRFVWDLRYSDATGFPGMILWGGGLGGPLVTPGNYQVKLTVDGKTQTQAFEILKDPRVSTTADEFSKQLALLLKIRDKLSETNRAILEIRDVRGQIDSLTKRVREQQNMMPVTDAGKALNNKLRTIEETLYQTKNRSSQDPLNFPIRLNNKLAALGSVVASADAEPTLQSYVIYEDLVTRIDAELRNLRQILDKDLAAFNRMVKEQNVPAVTLKPDADAEAR